MKTGKGFTGSYRADADTVDVDYKECCYVKRARSTQMAFQNRRAGLEIFHKKNIVRLVGDFGRRGGRRTPPSVPPPLAADVCPCAAVSGRWSCFLVLRRVVG